MKFRYAKGATPLTQDDIHNLIPSYLNLQSQLDEWEQFNIIKAENWAFSAKRNNILTIEYIKQLHYKMFCDTWKWPGKFRTYQTNIGVESIYIAQELKILVDDVEFWLNNNTYNLRELAVRLHHRLVFIHPFPNGNGRLSRLIADIFINQYDQPIFTWGKNNLIKDSLTRDDYLKYLKQADKGDLTNLVKFADS
ncbi:MAG: mobile mystery protein B [Rickettsiaceae bacterium]|nr:mobile mystery protein B [Rickettsiaceae bacterium]